MTDKEQELEIIKNVIRKGFEKANSRNEYTNEPHPYFESQITAIAECLQDENYRKADDLLDEIAGLTGKCEALQKDNENLMRAFEAGRDYKYCDSCNECDLQDICKYSEDYNFCEDCKEYPECTIIGYHDLPCGRHVECNNGFEEKSIFDDDDEEDDE